MDRADDNTLVLPEAGGNVDGNRVLATRDATSDGV